MHQWGVNHFNLWNTPYNPRGQVSCKINYEFVSQFLVQGWLSVSWLGTNIFHMIWNRKLCASCIHEIITLPLYLFIISHFFLADFMLATHYTKLAHYHAYLFFIVVLRQPSSLHTHHNSLGRGWIVWMSSSEYLQQVWQRSLSMVSLFSYLYIFVHMAILSMSLITTSQHVL